jgi:hypothetical protein
MGADECAHRSTPTQISQISHCTAYTFITHANVKLTLGKGKVVPVLN